MTDMQISEMGDFIPQVTEAVQNDGPEASPETPLAELVIKALEELRPHLQRDGGDIELIDIDGDIVVVEMKGSCVGCVLSSVTLAGVRKKLIDMVGRPLKVVPKSAFIPLRRMKAAM